MKRAGVVVGLEGEKRARFMGEGRFIGLAGFLGERSTSTLRIGDFAGEQRRSSSWFTVTLFGDAVGKRFALFGWIEGDLQGVRDFRAGLRGVRKAGDLASFTGEQNRFLEGVVAAGALLGLTGDLLDLGTRLRLVKTSRYHEMSPGRRFLRAVKQISNALGRDFSRAEQRTLPHRSLRLRNRGKRLARTIKGKKGNR